MEGGGRPRTLVAGGLGGWGLGWQFQSRGKGSGKSWGLDRAGKGSGGFLGVGAGLVEGGVRARALVGGGLGGWGLGWLPRAG